MTAPLTIVHAVSSARFAGVEQFVRRLAIRQAQDGHRVIVFGGEAEHMSMPLDDAGAQWAPATSTWAVMKAVRRHLSTADVVNTHMTAADAAAVAARMTARGNAPIVATRHFAQRRGSAAPGVVYRMLERGIDAEIAVSQAVADRISVPSTVIHPGLESGPLPDASQRGRTVLVAQRLQAEKRTDVAIRAFALSGVAQSGWDLAIAGAGPESDPLAALAAQLGVGEHVRLLGFRDDIPTLMAQAGLLFASSPLEGFGLTVLEAMAAGLPIVASDNPAHAEILGELGDRALFTSGDVDAAAARLRSLVDDSAARSRLGQDEHARQVEEFSLRRQADATETVYRDTIELRRRAR
jgi:glycosyltransferase involved in cell wall biosynthesis